MFPLPDPPSLCWLCCNTGCVLVLLEAWLFGWLDPTISWLSLLRLCSSCLGLTCESPRSGTDDWSDWLLFRPERKYSNIRVGELNCVMARLLSGMESSMTLGGATQEDCVSGMPSCVFCCGIRGSSGELMFPNALVKEKSCVLINCCVPGNWEALPPGWLWDWLSASFVSLV